MKNLFKRNANHLSLSIAKVRPFLLLHRSAGLTDNEEPAKFNAAMADLVRPII
jgi:hypothetical protein